jgi:hypothetical protein
MAAETLGHVSFESAVREAGRHPERRHQVRAHLVTIQGRRRWLYEIVKAVQV